MLSEVVPELFVRVRLWATLVVSMTIMPKFRLPGESVAVICGGGCELLPPPPPQPTRIIAIAGQDKTKNKLRITLPVRQCGQVNYRNSMLFKEQLEISKRELPVRISWLGIMNI